jgi:hypothetical protein
LESQFGTILKRNFIRQEKTTESIGMLPFRNKEFRD